MKELLDLKDKRILFELEQDSRQSLNQLSKKVGLKKETLFHRIKNLEKRRIIKGYLTEIDIYKLGFQYYLGFHSSGLFLQYRNIIPNPLSKCEFIRNIKDGSVFFLQLSQLFDNFMSIFGRHSIGKTINQVHLTLS